MKRIAVLLLLMSSITGFAQKKNYIVGCLKNKKTLQAIEYASITNLSNSKTAMADEKGYFKVFVSEKQLLSFASVGYNFDTVRITPDLLKQDTVEVLLSPLSETLQDVTVSTTAKYNAYQLDSIARRKNYFGSKSDAKIPVASLANSGAGLGINLDHFYTREKTRDNWIDMFDVIERDQFINYHFTPEIVVRYTALKGDDLLLFMQQYRPKYDWLRKHSGEEDILYYINDKLKSFNKKK